MTNDHDFNCFFFLRIIFFAICKSHLSDENWAKNVIELFYVNHSICTLVAFAMEKLEEIKEMKENWISFAGNFHQQMLKWLFESCGEFFSTHEAFSSKFNWALALHKWKMKNHTTLSAPFFQLNVLIERHFSKWLQHRPYTTA